MSSATNAADGPELPSAARRPPSRRRAVASSEATISSESEALPPTAQPGSSKRSRSRTDGEAEGIASPSSTDPPASGADSSASIPTVETGDTLLGKRDPKRSSQGREATARQEQVPAGLSFQQARTALDLLIAELQSGDLQVEDMLSLYQRAQAYAEHCEAVLQRIDQDVIEWDVLQQERDRNG